MSGQTDYMVGLDCTRDAAGYHCQTKLVPLTEAANTERKVPLEWINAEGNGVKQEFIDYAFSYSVRAAGHYSNLLSICRISGILFRYR